ncbi:hypothetical protein K466DRAFT_606117 [Polyporus arcularius HHB13444]|uniref:Uncharacterized protein n=1 Tax=Polyporus arcularius HHB13444 TaxID=1314778 RepID=A0A5C3NQF6_9APHY|nr:hypothetical protein K466DRAFT_606117 [Polyporus arcularius HHB13444]
MASPTPRATSEDRKHPPELTPETYERCLQRMINFGTVAIDEEMASSTILHHMRTIIAKIQPEVSLNTDSPERMFVDDPQLKIDIDQGNFEGVLNSHEKSLPVYEIWPGQAD